MSDYKHGIPPFLTNDRVYGMCRTCGEKDSLNCFRRCPDCETQYQKDVLLEIIAATNPMDAETNKLLLTEYRLRADELLARSGKARTE